jgi:hypothetical protein
LQTARQVKTAIEGLDTDRYNGFNVMAVDAEDLVRAQYDGAGRAELLGPGVHGATNWRDGTEGAGKRAAAEAQVAQAIEASASEPELLDRLKAIAASHERGGDPRYSMCCHAGGYGTRSCSIVLAHPTALRFLHCEGAPCSNPFEDHSSRLVKLLPLRGPRTA